MSNLKVYLSPLAEFKLDMLLNYIEAEWGAKPRNSFLDKLKRSLDRLSVYPESGRELYELKGVYRCIITRHTSVYYRIRYESIEIITVIDNRQDPEIVFDEIKQHFGGENREK